MDLHGTYVSPCCWLRRFPLRIERVQYCDTANTDRNVFQDDDHCKTTVGRRESVIRPARQHTCGRPNSSTYVLRLAFEAMVGHIPIQMIDCCFYGSERSGCVGSNSIPDKGVGYLN